MPALLIGGWSWLFEVKTKVVIERLVGRYEYNLIVFLFFGVEEA
jgi:hypothetical protein